MKHIKTVAMSLLLANSFSSNEVTWKEIEAEIKPHIEEVESDFSELTKSLPEIYKQYREATSTATEFDDFGDYFTEKEKEGKKVRDENMLEKKRQQNKNEAKEKRSKKEEIKQKAKEDKAKNIEEIKTNIKTITDNFLQDKITINKEKITSDKDILQGIDKILNIIKKTPSIFANFNNLKTFSDIDEFTKNYNQIRKFIEKNQDKTIETFFYKLVFSAIKEKKADILEFFDFPKSIITEIKENKKIEKLELKDNALTKIAQAVYNYILNLNKILYTNQTKFDEFILKNKINEYVLKEKNLNKETYNKKVFKNKSLNNMTIFEALSSAKNKEIVKTESPTILAILEKFKGTEEENKKMTVRRAINIIIDFTELTFLQEKKIDKNSIRNEKQEKQKTNFDSKKNERIEKLEKEIEKLEAQKKNSNNKDSKILDKEINALKKTIEKITQEEYKEQKYIDENTDAEETSRAQLAEEKIAARGQAKREITKIERKPSIKRTKPSDALKKAKQKGKAAKRAQPGFNTIDESDTKEKREKEALRQKVGENYKAYDNKESSGSNILTKEELAKAKKGRSNEV
jgi:hypothetical protein